MTIIMDDDMALTVAWSGLDADDKGTLEIQGLPKRLDAGQLRRLAVYLAEAGEHPIAPFRNFVFLAEGAYPQEAEESSASESDLSGLRKSRLETAFYWFLGVALMATLKFSHLLSPKMDTA